MHIEDNFEFEDKLSGMKLQFKKGDHLNSLHIEFTGEREVDNRDFFFTHEGEFDGVGSSRPNSPMKSDMVSDG